MCFMWLTQLAAGMQVCADGNRGSVEGGQGSGGGGGGPEAVWQWGWGWGCHRCESRADRFTPPTLNPTLLTHS
jgi:hypothetical protein